MTAEIIDFAFPRYTDRSNARKAALKRFHLEPSEFQIKPTADGKFEIIKLPGALAESPAPAPAATPAEQGIAAARADAAKIRGIVPLMAEIEAAQIRAADPEDRAAEAADIFTCKRPDRRHLGALESAYAGKMPAEPDLSSEVHAFYRKHLARAVELAAARDLTGLAEFIKTIKPGCSSRKPIVAYGKLALIALSR
jgi:hypothetical protein